MRSLRLRVAPNAGAVVLVALAVGYVVLWAVARPAHEPTGRFIGEICGAEAVFLLSCCLVLAALLPADRARVRRPRPRRRLAQARRRRGRSASRTARRSRDLGARSLRDVARARPRRRRARRAPRALRLGARAEAPRRALARTDPAPRARELRALADRAPADRSVRRRRRRARRARRPRSPPVDDDPGRLPRRRRDRHRGLPVPRAPGPLLRSRSTTTPSPRFGGRTRRRSRSRSSRSAAPLAFTPGQFIVLAFGGAGAWERHPFSVASAPSERLLEVSIKASGDYTRDLHDKVQKGTPAKVAGPFGGFDYRRGGQDQIWIAGGIGVTPFLSWIRSLDDGFDRKRRLLLLGRA